VKWLIFKDCLKVQQHGCCNLQGWDERYSPWYEIPTKALQVRHDVLGVRAILVGVDENDVLHHKPYVRILQSYFCFYWNPRSLFK
jgi:hypothetical protein